MENLDIVGIIGACVTALGVIGGGVKYMIDRYDKKKTAEREEDEKRRLDEIAERNVQRDEIKSRITKLENDVASERRRNKRLIKMIASCEHTDCVVKGQALSELDEE